MKNSKSFVRIVAIALAVLMAGTVLIGAISASGAGAAPSQALSRLKDQQTKLAQEKKDIKAQIDALKGQVTTALAKKSVIDEQLILTEAEIDNITEQIAEYQNLIIEKEGEVEQALIDENDRYELYKARIRMMEENGTISYYAIAFGARNWSDLLARIDYIQEIMTYDEGVYNALVEARQATQEAKAGLEAAKEESEATKAELVVKTEELAAQVAEAQVYIQQIENDLVAFEALEAEQAAEEKEILRQIEEMAAELERIQTVNGTGSFVWPSDASRRVTSPFGTRWHPVHQRYAMHYGIDIGASYGTNIIASDSGTVLTSTYSSSYGNYVVITHGNGYRTLYAHMSKLLVKKGDNVTQSDVIGLVGSTGVSTGPHIHYEIIKDGAKVNPLDFLTNYTLS